MNGAQYSLRKILLIWACSSLPMGILAYVVTPLLIPVLGLPPFVVYWLAVIIGLAWQFILSLIILKREGYALEWSAIRERMHFQTPRHYVTGVADKRLYLAVIPFILLSAVLQVGGFFPDVDALLKPVISRLPQYDLSALATPENKGAWWILGLYIITAVFNYFLGEEFMYRGILLPKMKGVFGKWDWFVNGLLFGFYHLHKPQVILSTALIFGFVFAFPSARFRSTWMAVIIHGMEGLLGLALVLGVILGLAK